MYKCVSGVLGCKQRTADCCVCKCCLCLCSSVTPMYSHASSRPSCLLPPPPVAQTAEKPTALLRWTSCRALPPLCPLEWCLPATSAAAAAHTASNAQLQGRLCDPRVVGGAARSAMQGLPPGPKQQAAAARAAATARQAARACPAQHLPHQYAGPAVPGLPAPLTPAQVLG